jgi:DNA repair protein RadC
MMYPVLAESLESEEQKITQHLGDIPEFELSTVGFPRRIGGLNDVISALSGFLRDREDECLVVLHVSEQMEHLQFTCHRGDQVSVVVPTRKIIADAAELGTKGLILAHNHPSGDSNPSDADLRFTRHLAEACELLDVSLLDHLIFGQNRWTSLRQRGLL